MSQLHQFDAMLYGELSEMPARLREIADKIEAGAYSDGKCHLLKDRRGITMGQWRVYLDRSAESNTRVAS